MQIRLIKREDAEYPANLRNIHKPPPELYVNGTILPQDEAAVALVGTRRPTHYGMQTCERLAYDLAIRGITVISGMAIGIDTAAHRGALRAGGRTIAILGSGHNNIYPQQNIGLYRQIAKNGAVISEFPNDAIPDRWHFPRRNRIISGMSLGVVIVEAPRKSGALITADFALEQGREVFSLPGKINSLVSEGTHGLIKDGAKLVEGVDDIIEELKEPLNRFFKEEKKENRLELPLNTEEEKIFKLLTDEPRYIDLIARESGLPVHITSGFLTQLTVKRLIKELPGKRYISNIRR